MPDYKKIREMVSHRVTLDYDTGARVVGYVATCAPPQGAVQMIILSKASVTDAGGMLLGEYEELPIVPNNVVGIRITEGPM